MDCGSLLPLFRGSPAAVKVPRPSKSPSAGANAEAPWLYNTLEHSTASRLASRNMDCGSLLPLFRGSPAAVKVPRPSKSPSAGANAGAPWRNNTLEHSTASRLASRKRQQGCRSPCNASCRRKTHEPGFDRRMGTGEWIGLVLWSPFCCRWGSACFLSCSTLPRFVRRSEPGARGFPGGTFALLGSLAVRLIPARVWPQGLVEWLEHGY